EPFAAIGVRVVGWRINDPQMGLQLGHHLAYQRGACGGMGPQGVHDAYGAASSGTGPSDSGLYLDTKDSGRPSWGQAACKPAVTPVHEPKAIDFVVGPWSLYEALATATFATPHAGQGRMERHLDLILEIDIGMRQKAEQFCKIGRHFSE